MKTWVSTKNELPPTERKVNDWGNVTILSESKFVLENGNEPHVAQWDEQKQGWYYRGFLIVDVTHWMDIPQLLVFHNYD